MAYATDLLSQPCHGARPPGRACTILAVAGVLIASSACIGETPEEALRAAQGGDYGDDDDDDGEPEHRPGQPCLVCHSVDYHPGEDVFVIAGTVYLTSADPDRRGIEGAEVSFVDAAGREFTALTNRTGNFMVRVDERRSQPEQRSRGRLRIPWEPQFPVAVSVTYQGQEQAMESKIWREGSCAGCHHGSTPGVDHVEKVWVEEVAP